MTLRRIAIALVFALGLSGIFTFWINRMLTKSHAVAPTKQRYVAAARDLEPGALLKPPDLKEIDWPATMPLQGIFLKPEDLAGRVVLYPLAEGEPILARQLAAPGSGVGLTAKIPEGMRAISLRSDDVVGVDGFLLPGTHVDVLVTWHREKTAEPVTAAVLSNVQVLAAGHQIQPDPEGKPASVDVVTLLVTPPQADKAVLASTQGAVHFVLRNGSDSAETAATPIGLGQLTEDVPIPVAKPTPARAGPKPYTVETLLGTKRVDNSFN